MFNNFFMEIALNEAKNAYDKNEIPVGAVIVYNPSKKIIAACHNLVEEAQNPTFHAEMLAINKACIMLNSKYLQDCSIYSTLEPCAMCASAIAHARISCIYYGASDKKHGAIENNIKFFSIINCFSKPQIYPGIHAKKARKLIQNFFNKKLRK